MQLRIRDLIRGYKIDACKRLKTPYFPRWFQLVYHWPLCFWSLRFAIILLNSHLDGIVGSFNVRIKRTFIRLSNLVFTMLLKGLLKYLTYCSNGYWKYWLFFLILLFLLYFLLPCVRFYRGKVIWEFSKTFCYLLLN